MGLSAMHPLIGQAKRTDCRLHMFDKDKRDALLRFAGMAAERTQFTQPCQQPIDVAARPCHGINALPTLNACPNCSPTP